MSERVRILTDDELLTITTFASNRFNAAALTEYLCAMKIAECYPPPPPAGQSR